MATTASSEASEGPVMGLINKRLRALRKKLNRIAQMEDSISQGKTLNKEQEEVLRSKPSVVVLIDEFEKLRSPLSAAVSEEISLATKHQATAATVKSESENAVVVAADLPKESSSDDVDAGGADLEDLVNLLYFGSIFDLKSPNEFTSIMLTRTHERGCCLTYDYVTDDATDLLGDRDLDSISKLGSLVVSRPADSFLSHKKALERCVEHAKLWLANSDQPIESNSNNNLSYAALKEKLKKIMASDYFTTSPEMKAPVEVAAAAAAGSYASFQVTGDTEVLAGNYQQKEDASNCNEQESVVNNQTLQDQHQKDVSVTEMVHGQQEQAYTRVEAENADRDYDAQFLPRGSYQNHRGGRRGARRGYFNGRGGGRGGGGGGYLNGQYESYDNSGGNGYQRSHYNNRGRGRGRGGGVGNGNSYNNRQDSNATVAS
ncbi:unnamed protein product [Cochlearia groenlandica]